MKYICNLLDVIKSISSYCQRYINVSVQMYPEYMHLQDQSILYMPLFKLSSCFEIKSVLFTITLVNKCLSGY